jgi:hypothetical protein
MFLSDLATLFVGTGNAFEATAATIQEGMKLAKGPELRSPPSDNLVAVVA